MKKTIALLLAMAGVAMANDIQTLNWSSESPTCDFSQTKLESYTLAFVLDWNALVQNPDYIFYVSGEYSRGSAGSLSHLGLGLADNVISVWRGFNVNPESLETKLDTAIDTTKTNVAFATLVYANYCRSATSNYPSFYLTLWGSDGAELASYSPSSNAQTSVTPYRSTNDSITVNADVVKYAELHYGIEMNAEEAKDVASALVSKIISGPAAPEPTTATLSLLALSALAARRRRR